MAYSFFSEYEWHKRSILIVEDDAANLFFLKELLSRTGARVIVAINGKEAMKQYEENPGIDVVIMDIQIPEVDGYETTRQLKSRNPKIPVIAQTAFAMAEDREKCLEAGCDEYLAKPVMPYKLLQTIQGYFKD